jgi:hypothetical protein
MEAPMAIEITNPSRSKSRDSDGPSPPKLQVSATFPRPFGPPTPNHRLPITNHRLPITDYRLPATNLDQHRFRQTKSGMHQISAFIDPLLVHDDRNLDLRSGYHLNIDTSLAQ